MARPSFATRCPIASDAEAETGIGAAGSAGSPFSAEQRRHFLAEQRIAIARHVQLSKHRSGKPSAATHHGLEGRAVQRPDVDGGDAALATGQLDLHYAETQPGREPDWHVIDTPESEIERPQ